MERNWKQSAMNKMVTKKGDREVDQNNNSEQ